MKGEAAALSVRAQRCQSHYFSTTPRISKKLKLRLKNTIINKTLTYASETWILTTRDRKQINIFERKLYRRILGPVYDNEKENWRILTHKEIYAMVKKPTITVDYVGLGMYREWKKTEFPKQYYI